MHTCCNLDLAPSKSILSVNEREKDVLTARKHRESDGNFDKDHRTNPSNVSFIRETIPLVARLPGWPNYDWRWKKKASEAPFPIKSTKAIEHTVFDDFPSRSGLFSQFLFYGSRNSKEKLIFSALARLEGWRVCSFRQLFFACSLFRYHTPRDNSLVV